jgi:hypothetical protein
VVPVTVNPAVPPAVRRPMIRAPAQRSRFCVPSAQASVGTVQTTVPTHTPALEHTSRLVMGLPSSHVTPGRGVIVHVAAPLHARIAQVSLAQVIAVPRQPPDVHTSVWVHASPSSQRAAVRHCQAPPSLVHTKDCPPHESDWQSEWVIASHANSPPPPQVPEAFAAPHPWQTRPVRMRLALH